MEETEQLPSELSALQQQIMLPMGGRGLLPEEVAENKAKGREWSKLVKVKGRKIGFTEQELAERKEKNRIRQKRFRERQKNKEAEEEARTNVPYHAATSDPQQHHMAENGQPAEVYPPENTMDYSIPAPQPKFEPHMEQDEVGRLINSDIKGETLAQKRKRLGRERQARFREKRRSRSVQDGDPASQHGEGMSSPAEGGHGEPMGLADLQRLSAQLSGYYGGLTQGLSQEEHQTVMRHFLDGLREELGDENMGGVANYVLFEHAHSAITLQQAQAQYVNQGIVQGLHGHGMDIQAFQAAIAAAQMPQQELQSQLHNSSQINSEQHVGVDQMQSHLGHMVMHPSTSQAAQIVPGQHGIAVDSSIHSYQRETDGQPLEHRASQSIHDDSAQAPLNLDSREPGSQSILERAENANGDLPERQTRQHYRTDLNEGYGEELQNTERFRQGQELEGYNVARNTEPYSEHNSQEVVRQRS